MHSPSSTIPEEILEYILALAILSPLAKPSLLLSSVTYDPRLASLLVCKLWLRIATPLYYQRISLASPKHGDLFISLLKAKPEPATFVRELKLEGTFPQVLAVVKQTAVARPEGEGEHYRS